MRKLPLPRLVRAAEEAQPVRELLIDRRAVRVEAAEALANCPRLYRAQKEEEMSKEQIEEMARIIAVNIGYCCEQAQARCAPSCTVYSVGCTPYKIAEILYNAGYRKKSEGADK